MSVLEQEESTMATDGIVSIETQWRELNMFYLSLLSNGGVDKNKKAKYSRLKRKYERLEKSDQKKVNELDKNLIDFKVTLIATLAKLNIKH